MAIQVDYSQLQNSANRLKSAQQDMENQLGQLQSMIRELNNGGFRTEIASGKFQESYDHWNKGTIQAIRGLEGMAGFLNRAIQQHQELDRQLGQSTGG